jgi:hypothetical protein
MEDLCEFKTGLVYKESSGSQRLVTQRNPVLKHTHTHTHTYTHTQRERERERERERGRVIDTDTHTQSKQTQYDRFSEAIVLIYSVNI